MSGLFDRKLWQRGRVYSNELHIVSYRVGKPNGRFVLRELDICLLYYDTVMYENPIDRIDPRSN